MRIATLNKRTFLDLVGSNDESLVPIASSKYPKNPPNKDEFYVLWDDDFGHFGLPSAIVVNDIELKDFLAWTSTFIGTLKPLTAFIRVVPYSIAIDFVSMREIPSFDGYDSACAAIIIAEALSNAPEKIQPTSLTPLLCGSTYSYVLARAFAFNLTFDSFIQICGKVSSVRALSGQTPRKVSAASILAIWYILYCIKCDSNNVVITNQYMNSLLNLLSQNESNKTNELRYYLQYIADACYQYKTYGDIDISTLKKFSSSVKFEGQHRLWDNTKENNVINFINIMSSLDSDKERPAFASGFLCGYFASKVAPGSFSHIDLVWPYLDKIPTALIWYAVFAGLSKKAYILQTADCLPLRVIRDLLIPSGLLSIPTCDISVDELEVLITGNSKTLPFKHGYSGHLQIEIVPNIIAKVKWIDPERQVSSLQQPINKPSYSNAAIDEMGALLRRMERVYRDLSGSSNVNPYRDFSNSPKSNSYAESKAGNIKRKKEVKQDKQDKLIE